jgi:hypothetical protein
MKIGSFGGILKTETGAVFESAKNPGKSGLSYTFYNFYLSMPAVLTDISGIIDKPPTSINLPTVQQKRPGKRLFPFNRVKLLVGQ